MLLVLQIAVCAVLVTSSFVAVRGLVRSMNTRLGIDPHNSLLVETDPQMAGYHGSQVPALQRRMIGESGYPWRHAGGSGQQPAFKNGMGRRGCIHRSNSGPQPSNAVADAVYFSASPEYFQAADSSAHGKVVHTAR